MKKIIGFFDSLGGSKLPLMAKVNVVYEEDGKYYIQYQLSKQIFSLSLVVSELRDKEKIEREVQTYLAQGISTIRPRLGDYTNNEDIPGNRYYFKEVNKKILNAPGYFPKQKLCVYKQDGHEPTELEPFYAIIINGTDAFVGNKEYILEQIKFLFEYPTDEDEYAFKIDMLYDLEKYDALSEEVKNAKEKYEDSQYCEEWQEMDEEGQILKLVYQQVGHK